MNYQFHKGSWRNNLLRVASHLFGDDDHSSNLDADSVTWRNLKNKIEVEELERSYHAVQDEFEQDNNFALEEQKRWQKSHTLYSQIVHGLDFLEPVAGIDY